MPAGRLGPVFYSNGFMRYFLLYVWVLLMCSTALPAQQFKLGERTNSINSCDKLESYIPYQADYTPIRRVRLIVHIFQKDDGSGNLPNTPEVKEYLQRVFNHMQWFYSQTEYMNPYPADKKYDQIVDTRIRFVVDTVLYHRNTDDWDFRKYTVTYDPGYKDSIFNEPAAHMRGEYLYKKYVTDNSALAPYQRDSALHLLLVEARGYQDRGMAAELYTKRWVYAVGTYYNYMKDAAHSNHWSPGMLLAHEVGHALGLTHPYDYGICKDLPHTPKGRTNNMMDCYPNQGRALTPDQIGLIHWSLSTSQGDLHDIVIPDWRTYHPDSAIHVLSGDTVYWLGSKELVGDLVLDRGAVLVVKCKLTMPPTSHIVLKPGAVLIVDGGHITADTGLSWGGIRIEKGRRFLIFGTERKGSLQLRNGGTLDRVGEG